MSSANAKRVVFSAFAEVAKAFAHRHRLEILEQLAQGERSVELLAERVGLSVANASQHLRMMRRAGLLASRRDGKRIFYQLSDSSALEAGAALQRVAERNLAEVREVIGGDFRPRAAPEPLRSPDLHPPRHDSRLGTVAASPRFRPAALIDAAVFSMSSPIWLSLMMSGGVSSMVSPEMRSMIPASWNECSSTR